MPSAPLGSWNLLGLKNVRPDGAIVLGLLVLLVGCRMAAFPESIWDQDEAYLGLAVADFDLAANQPHPPWFPLWILVGGWVAPFSTDPALGLRVMAAVLGIWTFFPLVGLFSVWVGRRLAVTAAVLYLFLPGPWFLAGRAHSDTPATFLLVLAAAWWLRRRPREADFVAGSVAAGLCLLVRPQLAPGILGLAVWRFFSVRSARDRLRVAGPLVALGAVGAVGMMVAAGGVAALASSFRAHAGFHVGGLADIDHSFAVSGLARCLVRPELAVLWLVLAATGVGAWARHRSAVGTPWPMILCFAVPLVVSVNLLADPTRARYLLPLLALSAGPVVIGLATIAGRWSMPLVALAVVVSAAVGLPQTRAYRSVESPPVAALRAADEVATLNHGVLVIDRTLVSFATYGRLSGWLKAPAVNDFQLEIGSVEPPPRDAAVAVYPLGHGEFVRSAASVEDHSWPPGWVRRLGPDRFGAVTVATRSVVTGMPSLW